jgi:hypothetical protein
MLKKVAATASPRLPTAVATEQSKKGRTLTA